MEPSKEGFLLVCAWCGKPVKAERTKRSVKFEPAYDVWVDVGIVKFVCSKYCEENYFERKTV